MPGVIVEDRDTALPRAVRTDTSVAFFVGEAERGDHTKALEITSMARFKKICGAEVSYGYLYRSVNEYFRRGGSRCYIGRAVGPAQAKATANITGTGTTLVVNADSAGTWGNGATGGLSYQVINGPINGATHRVVIIFRNAVEVERTPEFNDRQVAVDWSANSEYVRFVLGGGSGLPTVVGATNLAGGTDDNASITAVHRETAMNLFLANLGPGQVACPGITAGQTHQDLIEHGQANNRAPVLDGPDTTVKATLTGATTALRLITGARNAAMFAPWVKVPGDAVGTTKTIPPSAIVCGLIAANDPAVGVAQASAGDYGLIPNAVDLTAHFSDLDAEDINNASVNLIRNIDDDIQVWGWRSLVDKTAVPNWWPWTTGRLAMYIRGNAKAVGRRLVFRKIDGFGHLLAEFSTKLEGFMKLLALAGDLYVDPDDPRPETSYRVNVDSDLNTPGDISTGFLEAEIQFRPPGMAEWVTIGVINVPITTTLS